MTDKEVPGANVPPTEEFDPDPLTFALLAAVTVDLFGMLAPSEFAIGIELRRILQDATVARLDGARLTPGSVQESLTTAGAVAVDVLNGALVGAGGIWTPLIREAMDLTARPEPPRRLD